MTKFILLTRSGKSDASELIFINPAHVVSVVSTPDGEGSEVETIRGVWTVLEDRNDIVEMFERADECVTEVLRMSR